MTELLSGVLVGLVGSLHCVGMCGPLVIALPIGSRAFGRFVTGRLIYHGGRVATYVLLGAAAGVLGSAAAFAGAQQGISIVVGAVMLAGVILPSVLRRISSRWSPAKRIHLFVRTRLSALFERQSLPALAGIGMLNGLLPCGLVYVALGTALTLGDPARAMIFLAGFGAGTIPALLGVGFAGKIVRGRGQRLLAIGLPIFTAALAILLILRGLNLGIPMVSPKVSVSHSAPAEPSCCGGG